ncbi:MAG: DNA polymerase III subunit gamma/tau [Bacteroidetes bacterium]|nr:DNA polymerase III subunit gamma/tau [Bacteroidota bacterium]MCL5026370.1 DNA polymerase III subunit gamma/tau [Chloroflexota bacterium]
MAREVFYRKFRSQRFEDIVGQEPITRTLRNAVRAGRLSHAYLFCGPRGVGKTSAARVLAKAVNCENSQDGEPCNECTSCRAISEGRCMDVLEIDAASNRQIDDIREIRDKVGYAPSEVRVKFYILDEAHMLTQPAANAILKTLEEPPPHVVFVLSTTDPHQLPATVLSRCQRFDFRRIPLQDTIRRLRYVCDQEGLRIDDTVLDYIGRLATGSLRDAESLLDQLVAYCGPEVSLEQVQAIVGTTGSQSALQLAGHVLRGETADALRLVNQAVADGAGLAQFSRSLVDVLRGVLLTKLTSEPIGLLEITAEGRQDLARMAEAVSAERLLEVVRIFSRVEAGLRQAFPPQLPLEVAVVEATLLGEGAGSGTARPAPASTAGTRDAPPVRAAQASVPPPAVAPADGPQVPAAAPSMVDAAAAFPASEDVPPPDLAGLRRRWGEVIAAVGRSNTLVQALLHDCEPIGLEGDQVTLGFRWEFHRQRIEDPANRRVVEVALLQLLGGSHRVRCVVAARQSEPAVEASEDPVIKTALSMGARIRRVSGPGGSRPEQ